VSGIAVLTRRPLHHVGVLTVGPTFLDSAPRRTALDVELDIDGTPLRLVAVHLTSRLPHGPPIQLRRLARLLPPPGTPTVVAGDHNFWGPGVVGLMPGWQRVVRGRTWPTRAPHSQIDHVLIRPGEIEVVDGRVLANLGSDHLPLRVELRLAERELRPATGR
jgi:endonuclease/exonuclease/phosphatase family metal-dependent hydrolase